MMEKSAVATTYSASAVTMIAGLSINEWAVLGGFLLGVATFVVNLWFKKEHLKLDRERSKKSGESS